MVLHANLVVYVPVVLQVSCVLVEFPAVHTAHRVDYQVVMQMARIDMCRHQYFKIGELFFGQLHSYGVGQLRRQPIPLRKGLDEMIELPPLRLMKALLGC